MARGILSKEGRWGLTSLDVLPAMVLLALSALFAWGHGPPVKGLPLAVIAVAIAWRRRAPVVALGGVAIGTVIADAVPPVGPMCEIVHPALMLVAFSVGALEHRRRLAFGTLVLLALLAFDCFVDPGIDPGALVVLAPMMLAVIAGGRVVRSHRVMAAELARRMRELELRREERTRLALALEQARLGREMEQILTRGVEALAIQAGLGLRRLPDRPAEAGETFVAIEESARGVLDELRGLLGVLRTDAVAAPRSPQPTMRELGALLDELRTRGLQVDYACEGRERALAPGIDVVAYRILQHALKAMHGAAGGAPVTVRVRFGARELELGVGAAVDGQSAQGAVGSIGEPTEGELEAVRERVALYGGTLHTRRPAGGGYVLRARLPLAAVDV